MTMSTLFEHLKRLFDEGLHSSVVQLLNIVLPKDYSGGSDIFTAQQELQAFFFFGQSLYKTKDYAKSERAFNIVLEVLRQLNRNASAKSKKGQPGLLPFDVSELDIRYRIHLCQRKRQQFTLAIKTLESIQRRDRTSKINYALGQLYQKEKNNKEAAIHYKEVLKDNPLALDVVVLLLKLDIREAKSSEIVNLITCNTTNISHVDWLPLWLKAHATLYSTESADAIPIFKKLMTRSNLKDNNYLQVALAEAYYFAGDMKRAGILFKRIYANDQDFVKGMDLYAALLSKENQTKELETLATRMLKRCEIGDQAPEPWIVVAYFAHHNNRKETRALYFTHKACVLSSNSVETLLLKAKVMPESKVHVDTFVYLQDAYNLATYRFDALRALTEAYIVEQKRSQASAMAQQALKSFGQTPRTLELYAKVCLSEPEKVNAKKNAKTSLEKAVRLDRQYLPAVYMLTQMYMEEKNYDKAIETLTKSLEYESNTQLHRYLGHCYNAIQDHEKALHHHNIAQKLEVSYRASTEAAQRLESQSKGSGSGSGAGGGSGSSTRGGTGASAHSSNVVTEPDLDPGDEAVESDNEMDESESEVHWSDGDAF